METHAHHQLKRLATAFLRENGCLAVATEVRCPISRFRIDAAGYLDSVTDDGTSRSHRRCDPRTIMIECKQSRADFLRDSENAEPLLALREQLERIRTSIEEHCIKLSEPQLRCTGTSLFAQLDEWDFSASRSPAYRKVLRQLRSIDEKLHGQTKFFLMKRYRLADRLYLAAPRGMIRRRELPPGWGLLECSPEMELLDVRFPAVEQATKAMHRIRLLRNIAVAASSALARIQEPHKEISAIVAQADSTLILPRRDWD